MTDTTTKVGRWLRAGYDDDGNFTIGQDPNAHNGTVAPPTVIEPVDQQDLLVALGVRHLVCGLLTQMGALAGDDPGAAPDPVSRSRREQPRRPCVRRPEHVGVCTYHATTAARWDAHAPRTLKASSPAAAAPAPTPAAPTRSPADLSELEIDVVRRRLDRMDKAVAAIEATVSIANTAMERLDQLTARVEQVDSNWRTAIEYLTSKVNTVLHRSPPPPPPEVELERVGSVADSALRAVRDLESTVREHGDALLSLTGIIDGTQKLVGTLSERAPMAAEPSPDVASKVYVDEAIRRHAGAMHALIGERFDAAVRLIASATRGPLARLADAARAAIAGASAGPSSVLANQQVVTRTAEVVARASSNGANGVHRR